jgi:hypothetical protein
MSSGVKSHPSGPEGSDIHGLLLSLGYKLVDDAWGKDGRYTYAHDEEATRGHLAELVRLLRGAGWERDRGALRGFRHPTANLVIELEPGGSGVTGHLLHQMRRPD